MSPKNSHQNKLNMKQPKGNHFKAKMKNKHDKSMANLNLSKLVGECSKRYVTSPRMLTHTFLKSILDKMKFMADKEKSQSKVGVINQISFDLTDFISDLDVTNRLNTSDNVNGTSRDLPMDVKVSLMELKSIDESIMELMGRKNCIYERLESLGFSNNNEANRQEVDDLDESHMDDLMNASDQAPPIDVNSDPTADELSNLPDQFFDEDVVSAAALSAQLVVPTKREINVNIESTECLNINKFADHCPSHLLMLDKLLICACKNGTLVRFCFKGSFVPHLPHRTNTFEVCDGPISEMIMWNNSLIVAATSGSIIKCNMRCKVIKAFPVNEEISGMTENKGLLYVSTKAGKLHIINLRSLTLHKDSVELTYVVKSIRFAMYNKAPIIVCLTDKGEIIGTSITDGHMGTAVFKFKLPGVIHCDVGTDFITPHVTFFCGSAQNVTFLNLEDGNLSQGKMVRIASTSMLVYKHLLFLGSKNGDILIVNVETMNTYFYQRVVNEKITSLAYLHSILYLGTEAGLYCLCLENNQDILVEP